MTDLRRIFSSPPEGVVSGDGCPDPDLLWRAVRHELPAERFADIVDHTAACPACTVAFRMARRHHLDETRVAEPRVGFLHDVRRWSWAAAGAAAALLIVAGFIATGRLPSRPAPPVFRATVGSGLRSLVADDASLPRDAFVLRWSPGPPDCRYTVRVTNDSLEPIIEARGVQTTEYRVAPALLAKLPAGSRVFWQVEAVGTAGSRIVSPTFVVRAE